MRRLILAVILIGSIAVIAWVAMPKRQPSAPERSGPHQPGLVETLLGALIPHSH